MKVLVVGSGGREHILCWKLSQSPKVTQVFCAPGNGGTEQIATNVNIQDTDISQLVKFAIDNQIDLTVVGPELPLTLGIVDEFKKNHLNIFGPSKNASQMEGSKKFAKEIMNAANVPTAQYEEFSNYDKALEYIKKANYPLVIKADGLAAGKGVGICHNYDESQKFLELIFIENQFGSAGQLIIIEEFLNGEEASILALVDKTSIKLLPSSQDHKRVGENDSGPNTGGMGAYSPAPLISPELEYDILKNIIEPTITELKRRNIDFQGVLYAGLMITDQGPKVLEYNVRFGDPEAQVVLFQINTDLFEILNAVAQNKLDQISIETNPGSSICIVLCSEGYPGKYQLGIPIQGADQKITTDSIIFHAGTKRSNQQLVTNGGRVLGVTSQSKTLIQARNQALDVIKAIQFNGMHYRKDIGSKAIQS